MLQTAFSGCNPCHAARLNTLLLLLVGQPVSSKHTAAAQTRPTHTDTKSRHWDDFVTEKLILPHLNFVVLYFSTHRPNTPRSEQFAFLCPVIWAKFIRPLPLVPSPSSIPRPMWRIVVALFFPLRSPSPFANLVYAEGKIGGKEKTPGAKRWPPANTLPIGRRLVYSG